MTAQEKEFAKDLLEALDKGMNLQGREQTDYDEDLTGDTRKEILKTIRLLISKGYRKHENSL